MASVLMVDESHFITKTMQQFMEAEGHEVIGVGTDGNQGFALYKEHQPDLVTLDITMPDKDGRECLQKILSYDEDAKVIMVSAVKEHHILVECLKVGAKGFIEKPLKFKDEEFCQEFRETIEEALEEN